MGLSERATWVAPRLVVLVRAKPEESVLVACKLGGHMTVGPFMDYLRCEGPKLQQVCGKCKQGGRT